MICGHQSGGFIGDAAASTESVAVVLLVVCTYRCALLYCQCSFWLFSCFRTKTLVCLSRTTELCASVYDMFLLCVCTRWDVIVVCFGTTRACCCVSVVLTSLQFEMLKMNFRKYNNLS